MSWIGLKKKLTESIKEKRKLVDRGFADISIRRQCELLGISRSGLYYDPFPECEDNLNLMRLIDEKYTKTPVFGSRRITALLQREGMEINRKRIQRLMRVMGLEGVQIKKTKRCQKTEHKIYPYLLKGVDVVCSDQVWSTDITYIPMRNGFMYLTAIMDWHSRYVLEWKISNTLDGWFCREALKNALSKGKPDIFNTDQGSQYTSSKFTKILEKREIKVSMDGRGRAFDNIFIERLWRSVKYEDIYLKNYETGKELYQGIGEYFDFYNRERPHQSLDYRTPIEVYHA